MGQWYVALDGDDTDDCLSTTTPCATINVPITQTLGWQGGDPDAGDTVTYTIAISVSGQSPVVATTALTGYMPSLIANTTYYWAITATDGISTTIGPTWRFSTVGLKYIYLPLVVRD